MTETSTDGLTRRNFLRSVGVTGGAGALFATMGAMGLAPSEAATRPATDFVAPRASDFRLSGRRHKSVVILGGGIAGLASAYELGKAGYHCTILEARSRTGGRNFTVRNGTTQTDLHGQTQTARFSEGQYLNAGPARIPGWMVTLDYCRELGVPIEAFTNVNADAYIYNEKAGMTAPVRYRTAKADVYGYVGELLAKATDKGALDTLLTAQDKEKLLDFLDDWGQLGADHSYTGGENRGFASYPKAWNDYGTPLAGPPALSEVFGHELGRTFSFEFEYDQAMMMFQPVGGMDQIPQALTRAVGGHKIKLGAVVTRVADTADGVRVDYTDEHGHARRVEADFCIAALPPHILAKTPHNLGQDVQHALSRYSGEAVGKIGLEYRRRWWEEDERIYGGITETDLDVTHIWYPSYGFHGRRGVVVGYYNYDADATAYGNLSPTDRMKRAVSRGVKIHGAKYRDELEHHFSIAWHLVPHIEGGWTSPPYRTADYERLQRPAGHVYFAGDWLSEMVAWQHGAFWSARDAVTALHRRVMSG